MATCELSLEFEGACRARQSVAAVVPRPILIERRSRLRLPAATEGPPEQILPEGNRDPIYQAAKRILDIAGAAALVPDEAVEAFGIAGTPEHCAGRLRDFVEAGLQEPVLGLLGNAESCRLGLEVMRELVQ